MSQAVFFEATLGGIHGLWRTGLDGPVLLYSGILDGDIIPLEGGGVFFTPRDSKISFRTDGSQDGLTPVYIYPQSHRATQVVDSGPAAILHFAEDNRFALFDFETGTRQMLPEALETSPANIVSLPNDPLKRGFLTATVSLDEGGTALQTWFPQGPENSFQRLPALDGADSVEIAGELTEGSWLLVASRDRLKGTFLTDGTAAGTVQLGPWGTAKAALDPWFDGSWIFSPTGQDGLLSDILISPDGSTQTFRSFWDLHEQITFQFTELDLGEGPYPIGGQATAYRTSSGSYVFLANAAEKVRDRDVNGDDRINDLDIEIRYLGPAVWAVEDFDGPPQVLLGAAEGEPRPTRFVTFSPDGEVTISAQEGLWITNGSPGGTNELSDTDYRGYFPMMHFDDITLYVKGGAAPILVNEVTLQTVTLPLTWTSLSLFETHRLPSGNVLFFVKDLSPTGPNTGIFWLDTETLTARKVTGDPELVQYASDMKSTVPARQVDPQSLDTLFTDEHLVLLPPNSSDAVVLNVQTGGTPQILTDLSGAFSNNIALADLTDAPPRISPDDRLLEYVARVSAYDTFDAIDALGMPLLDAEGEETGYYISQVFSGGVFNRFQAVALEAPDLAPILALRGTTDLVDWLSNADDEGVGFGELRDVWDNGDSALARWIESRGPQGITLTGHSQGGAQAQQLAIYAAEIGVPIERVLTVNSAGISQDLNDRADLTLIKSVEHRISAGDIVSLAGETFLRGDVVFYDLKTFTEAGHANPLQHILAAHLDQWSRADLYGSKYGTDLSPTPRAAEPKILTAPSYADFASPDFSFLKQGDALDPEYSAFVMHMFYITYAVTYQGIYLTTGGFGLDNEERQILAEQRASDAAATVGLALASRGGAENLRSDVSEVVRRLEGGVEIFTDALNVAAAAFNSLRANAADIASIIASWTAEQWVELASWTQSQWQAVRTWTTETWAAATDLGASVFNAIGEGGATAARWVMDAPGNIIDGITMLLTRTDLDIGTAGDDRLSGTAASERIILGQGDDVFSPRGGYDEITLGTGADTVSGTAAELDGTRIQDFSDEDLLIIHDFTPGPDDIFISEGSTILDLDTDSDGVFDATITLAGRVQVKDIEVFDLGDGDTGIRTRGTLQGARDEGTPGDDALVGSAGDDLLRGGAGDDTILGADGGDVIDGGLGDDILDGGNGRNIIVSDGGRDLIRASEGSNTVVLSSTLPFSPGLVARNVSSASQVGTQVDLSLAGYSRIEAFIDAADTGRSVTIKLSEGRDALFLHDALSGFHPDVALTADAMNDQSAPRFTRVGAIFGEGGDDIIDLTSPDYSLAGQNILVRGGDGNDVIWGSDADERIQGEGGDDTLFGGIGADRLNGGLGADTFEFTYTSANSTLEDFDPSEGDTLRFYSTEGATFQPETLSLQGTTLSVAFTSPGGVTERLDIEFARVPFGGPLTLTDIQAVSDFV